jgi:hypothetical protein
MAILYLSILYIRYKAQGTYNIQQMSSVVNNSTVVYISRDDAFNAVYDLLDDYVGISKFNQTVPLLISGVAIGVCLVNRNFPKCLGHLIGATIVALLSIIVINSLSEVCKQFTTAFLWYTIAYVVFCIQSSNRIDANSLIGIMLSFIVLIFIDTVTFMGDVCGNTDTGPQTYIGMLLLGIFGGIGGFYATRSILGKAGLYDFSGCSCDDCDGQTKCAAGSKTRTVLAKQVGS